MTRTVAVVGGGAIGSQAAWRLAESGWRVTVLDRFAPPHRWGAHAGESRLIRSVPYLETASGDAEIVAASVPLWDELEARSGTALTTRCGALLIGPEADPALTRARAILRRRGDPPLSDLPARFPQFRPGPGENAVFDPLGGLVDPQRAVAAALRLAALSGAAVRTGRRVVGLAGTTRGIELDLGTETARFDRVVVATGAFVRDLVPELPVRARRLLLGWFAPKPEYVHRLAGMPSFLHTTTDGAFLYGGPSYDGRTVKIGTDAPWGTASDPAEPDRAVSDHDLAPMLAAVSRHFPWLDPTHVRAEMHVDGWSADGHGILGPWRCDDRVLLATGWSGHGFKISPVIGQIVASLLACDDPRFDITHLDPARLRSPRRAITGS